MTSPTSIAEAFLAIRWVNITNWLAAAISRALRRGLQLQGRDLLGQGRAAGVLGIDRGDILAQIDQVFSCPITAAGILLGASQVGSAPRARAHHRRRRGHVGTGNFAAAGQPLEQVGRFRGFASIAAKAAGVPRNASDEGLARRWDSMRISPAAVT